MGTVLYTARPFADLQSYEEAIDSARHFASRGQVDEAFRYILRAESFHELRPEDKQLAARLAYRLSLGRAKPQPERFVEARVRAQENTELGLGAAVSSDWFERARLEAATGDMALAKTCLTKAAELDPGDPYPWAELAFVGSHLREPKEQIAEYLDQATRLSLERGTFPEVVQYIANIKQVLMRSRRGQDPKTQT